MRIFISALENNSKEQLKRLAKSGKKIHDGLISYYYLEKIMNDKEYLALIDKCTDHLLVDSGAHSFQKNANVDWEQFTRRYAKWIKENDSDKILGYFEMDVDVKIGYENVKKLREILLQSTDKIIPVWHKRRGINEFKRMCHETKGDIVAVTGFRNEDIQDHQYSSFLKYAWNCGKQVHCLGMTRTKVLKKVPFNYVDSSSWKQGSIYGNALSFKNGKIVTKNVKGRYTTSELMYFGLEAYMQMAEYYNAKWSKVNHDLYIKMWFVISHKIKLWSEKINEIKYKGCSKCWSYWSIVCGCFTCIGTI